MKSLIAYIFILLILPGFSLDQNSDYSGTKYHKNQVMRKNLLKMKRIARTIFMLILPYLPLRVQDILEDMKIISVVFDVFAKHI